MNELNSQGFYQPLLFDLGDLGPPLGNPLETPSQPVKTYHWTPSQWAAALFSGELAQDLAWSYGLSLIGVKLLRRGGIWEMTIYAMREGVEMVYFVKARDIGDFDWLLYFDIKHKNMSWAVSRYPHRR